MSLSDRVVVMNDGRIEQVGSPREIYESPRTSFVAQFVGAANLLDGAFGDAGGTVRVGHLDLALDRPGKGAAGTACKVAIHSESVQLQPAGGPTGPNRFGGVVLDVFFLGRTQEVLVDVGGVSLRSTQFHVGRYAPGDRVAVYVAPASVMPV